MKEQATEKAHFSGARSFLTCDLSEDQLRLMEHRCPKLPRTFENLKFRINDDSVTSQSVIIQSALNNSHFRRAQPMDERVSDCKCPNCEIAVTKNPSDRLRPLSLEKRQRVKLLFTQHISLYLFMWNARSTAQREHFSVRQLSMESLAKAYEFRPRKKLVTSTKVESTQQHRTPVEPVIDTPINTKRVKKSKKKVQ